MASHFMQIYESDAFLIDQVGDFLRTGIRNGDAAVVIATRSHRIGIKADRAASRQRDCAIAAKAAKA